MDELLDVVNDEDRVTGQRWRSVVHQLGLQHRGVHVFLFTQDGKLLIQKRSKDRAAFPSAWDGSVSEHVKAGETYLEAAMRGLKEELGLTETNLQPIIKFRMNYGPNDNEICMLYQGSVDPTLVKFDPVEIERVECLGAGQLVQWMSEESFAGWFIQLIHWSLEKDSEVRVLQKF